MQVLKIYNTLSKQKEVFVPLKTGEIGMYVCGMTVYDFCHLGHARVLVAFDVITRYLRASGWKVNYVRNITDIDDKILSRANEKGEVYTDLTARFIDCMHEDEKRLQVHSPDREPRATAHIADIIAMVQTLIAKGYAYTAENGDVYYAVSKFDGYGKLSGKNPDELLAGARIEVGESKRDPRDFALWKSTAAGEVSWSSPWGNGRPGWHIECSAMSACCLGETFDIHGGGPDLPFPHHENEIAQSEAAHGKPFARYWMHAGAVRVDNEKMSKSLGNFFTIREILDKYHPEVVRYLLLSSHYRSHINYSEENLQTAKGALERFYTAMKGFDSAPVVELAQLAKNEFVSRFKEAMDDDFNTPEALAVLFDLVRALNTAKSSRPDEALLLASILKSLAAVLGVLQDVPDVFLQSGSADDLPADLIEQKISERARAKKDKNYALADAIRDELKARGVILQDDRESGATNWYRS
ncbi:MAG: cysteine--tRNA ligase [Pseudomonadales bacterium]|nr:cysteine--tRNA ligase [Pseudomonadales bacterium]